MPASVTSICNQALSRLGATRISDYEAETTLAAIQCRQHYEQARNSLLESHTWAFARARATLSEDTETPAFEWDHQFILPSDFLRTIEIYDSDEPYTIEGQRLLTNDSAVQLRYVRRITDPAAFDAMFIEALALSMALRLVMPLSQDKSLLEKIEGEFERVLMKAVLVNAATMEKKDLPQTWPDSRGSWANTTE